MPDIIGHPLDRVEEALRREGIAVRTVNVITPPPPKKKKYRPKEFEKKTKFVVFAREAGKGAVDLDVVECGEPGAMKNSSQ